MAALPMPRDDRWAACRFPVLSPPVDQALRAAVRVVLAEVEAVGILAAGSLVRGTGGPTSDLDLYVLHLGPWKRRLQRRFEGVPTEIFVNHPASARSFLREELASGRPITAHMLSTAFVVLDLDPVVGELRREAAEALAAPPSFDPTMVTYARYLAVDALDNARDVHSADPVSSALFVSRAVHGALSAAFLAASRFVPREKDLVRGALELVPALSRTDLETALGVTPAPTDRLAAAGRVVEALCGASTFFAWDSPPQPAPPGS